MIIGIVIGVAGVAVWDYIGDIAAEQRAAEFAEGYSKAKDKSAFIRGFDFGDGSAISLSNSSADEGSTCQDMLSMMEALQGMAGEVADYDEMARGRMQSDGYNGIVREYLAIYYDYEFRCIGG